MNDPTSKTSLGVLAQLACIWEATARKPGNVHRFLDRDDLGYLDLLASAAAIGPSMEKAWYRPVGEIVLEAIKATRNVVSTNANLGIVLLLTPLAAAIPGRPLRSEVTRILDELTVADAVLVYEAIRLAQPGGLGRVDDQDVAETPTVTLKQAMELAADRDRIAWQYAHEFADVLDIGVPMLAEAFEEGHPLENAILLTHLEFLGMFEDSLILRKHGLSTASNVMDRAYALQGRMLGDPGGPLSETSRAELAEFDAWLRTNRYNPGTSADLVAASLFAALREGMMKLPSPRWT
jgi:triphosphoribosyl-dephospho-CoA synthase